jgi:predicted DNA-binding transcriptional regulator AlpA
MHEEKNKFKNITAHKIGITSLQEDEEDPKFEHIPTLVKKLIKQVCRLEEIIVKSSSEKAPPDDEILDKHAAAKLLGLKPSSIYRLSMQGKLPKIKKNGRIWFLKQDLIDYLKSARIEAKK